MGHGHHHHHDHHPPGHELLPESAGVLMKRAASLAIAVAGTLIITKLIVWWYTDSLSLLSSLIDSAFDILASLVNLLAIRYSLMPADDDHRFGHGKAEDLAGLGQALLMAAVGLYICAEGVHRLFVPQPVAHGMAAMGVTVFAILLTWGLVTYQRYVIRKTNSTAIRADSLHYVTDLLTNAGVLVAIALSVWFGVPAADPIMAILISAYVIYTAWQIGFTTFHKLMDIELHDEERNHIEEIISGHAQVLATQDLKTRRAGLQRFIQFSIILDDEMSLLSAHRISDELEDALLARFPGAHIIIHQAPKSGRCHNTQQ